MKGPVVSSAGKSFNSFIIHASCSVSCLMHHSEIDEEKVNPTKKMISTNPLPTQLRRSSN